MDQQLNKQKHELSLRRSLPTQEVLTWIQNFPIPEMSIAFGIEHIKSIRFDNEGLIPKLQWWENLAGAFRAARACPCCDCTSLCIEGLYPYTVKGRDGLNRNTVERKDVLGITCPEGTKSPSARNLLVLDGCISQYIPPLGSVRTWYHII